MQVPGPSNVPDRILRAIAQPTIDHRGPDFARLGAEVLEGMKAVLKTTQPVIIYPASGTGAWEAALVNLLSPGDRVLMFETGHFALLWRQMAERLSLVGRSRPRRLAERRLPGALSRRSSSEDKDRRIKAVCCVHNETSTGVTSDIPAVRRIMDAVGHPALLVVDTISSLASMDYRHDEWGVDVTVAGSQKGLMLPPGLELQRGRQEGARRLGAGTAAALLLALGGDARPQPLRLLPLYAGDQSPLRPEGGARHAA